VSIARRNTSAQTTGWISRAFAPSHAVINLAYLNGLSTLALTVMISLWRGLTTAQIVDSVTANVFWKIVCNQKTKNARTVAVCLRLLDQPPLQEEMDIDSIVPRNAL